jgi:hypothetical protein
VPGALSIRSLCIVWIESITTKSAVERRENVAHRGRARQRDRRVAQPQPLRAQPHLRRGFLAADIDDRFARLREPSGRLQQQGRLADPRIAADQRCRPRDEPAAQRAVEFGDPAEHAVGHLAVGIERFERDRPPAFAEVMLCRKDRFTRLLDQRVPLAAIGALPLPAIGGGAAILADILAFRFGHMARIIGTKMERQPFPAIVTPDLIRGPCGAAGMDAGSSPA